MLLDKHMRFSIWYFHFSLLSHETAHQYLLSRLYVQPPQPSISSYAYGDGTQLKLIDNNLGSEWPFSSSSHYQWSSGSDRQLLFIFPTRVSLATITLHYYSDSDQGLPRLRFYAVPNDFDVWDTIIFSFLYVEVVAVPAGKEPGGHRNVWITVNFNTQKVLMYEYSSSFRFAVSEVEFFTCSKWFPLNVSIIISVPTTIIIATPLYITTSQQTLPITTTGIIIDLTTPPIDTPEGEHFRDNNGHIVSIIEYFID